MFLNATNIITSLRVFDKGLISIFLHIHPFGVGLDYICSYLQKFIPSLRTSTVEDLLDRLTILFHRDISGVGVNMERKWKFIGFNHDGLL